jgi:uncharacterized phage infection (PIP) family protein YhgE
MTHNRRHDDPAMALLLQLVSNTESIMTVLSDLQAKFQALSDAVTKEDSDINAAITAGQAASSALKKQIADLQAQLAAGSTVTAADLAALSAQADTITANVTAADAAVNAAAANLTPPAA